MLALLLRSCLFVWRIFRNQEHKCCEVNVQNQSEIVQKQTAHIRKRLYHSFSRKCRKLSHFRLAWAFDSDTPYNLQHGAGFRLGLLISTVSRGFPFLSQPYS